MKKIFLLILLIILACDDAGDGFTPILGCMNLSACNYNSSANQDDNSCQFPEEVNSECVCGQEIVDSDCLGVCGGLAVLDECGICDGNGSTCSSPNTIDYETQIQPIFNAHCTDCHGVSGLLNLTSYDKLMEGGESGDAVIPGNSSSSLLWQFVNDGVMPQNYKLNENYINLIELWINEGAIQVQE